METSSAISAARSTLEKRSAWSASWTRKCRLCILGSVKQIMEHFVLMDEDVDVSRTVQSLLDFNLRGVLCRL